MSHRIAFQLCSKRQRQVPKLFNINYYQIATVLIGDSVDFKILNFWIKFLLLSHVLLFGSKFRMGLECLILSWTPILKNSAEG